MTNAMTAKEDYARWVRLTSTAAIVVASTLLFGKLWAWWLTGSASLLASLLDSLTDVLSSSFSWFAIRYALTPADDEHRFGHGKAESLAGLAQAGFTAGSALFLLIHAATRLWQPVPVHDSTIGIAMMLISMLLTLALVLLQQFTVRRTRSTAIAADSLHYVGDLLLNGSVIAALLLSAYWPQADAVFAILIAFYIGFGAWKIVQEALAQLLDREVDDATREQLLQLIQQCDGVTNVHDLRTRKSGHQLFVQVHIEVPRDWPIWRAHDIAEAVETRIREQFAGADVIVHEDPSPL